MRFKIVAALLVLASCSDGTATDDEPPPMGSEDAGNDDDAASHDAGAAHDAGGPGADPFEAGAPEDGGQADAGPPPPARPDAGPPGVPPVAFGVPGFDPPHGMFDAPFELALITSPDATIRYTTDGTTPSALVGTEYTAPIPIMTTSVVRAVACLPTGACSATRTQTYIRLEDVIVQNNDPGPDWPRVFAKADVNGSYPADYEMDQEIVGHPNYVGAVVPALAALPSVSLVSDLQHWWDPGSGIYYNSNEKGRLWERPVSIEWIDPAGGSGFTENAGMRLHGQASRRPHRTPKKTLRVYFRKEYGAGKLDFPLLGEASSITRFDRILVRNGGNRSWPYWDRDQRREADYVADEWARRAQIEMGGLNARGTHAHLYLNGVYWGLYNVAELPDEKFLAAHLGGLDTDYDMIKADEDLGDIPVAESGSVAGYEELMGLLNVASVDDALHAEISARVDLVDLADFMILTHYIGKTDWPNHNWLAYRSSVGQDTRFRFIAWDNDSGLNKVDENNTIGEFPGSPVVIFNRLVTHRGFRGLLAERLYQHIAPGSSLSPSRCADRYRELTNTVDQAVIGESARWGDYSRDVFQWLLAEPPKSGPAYLYSRDLSLLQADPQDVVDDEFQKSWVQVRDEKLATYCPQRAGVLVEQYRANGWLD